MLWFFPADFMAIFGSGALLMPGCQPVHVRNQPSSRVGRSEYDHDYNSRYGEGYGHPAQEEVPIEGAEQVG